MRAFNEISSFDAFDNLKLSIKNEIESKDKKHILGIDEEEYKAYLVDKYNLEPLVVFFDQEIIGTPISQKEWVTSEFYREKYQTDTYLFTISYPFTGSSSIFKIHPSSWTMTSNDILIDEYKKTVNFSFKINTLNVGEFNIQKEQGKSNAFTNLENANRDVRSWNAGIKAIVNTYFTDQKAKFQKENDFFAAINIPIDKGTQSIFTPPTIKKKEIPQPLLKKILSFHLSL